MRLSLGLQPPRETTKIAEVEEILERVNFTSAFFEKIATSVIEKGGSLNHLKRVLEDDSLLELVTQAVLGIGPDALPIQKDEFICRIQYWNWNLRALEIDLFPGLKTITSILGQVDKLNPIVEDYPKQNTNGQWLRFEYFHSGKLASNTKPLAAAMKERGLRHATFDELLSFAKAYPGEQEKYRIAALGSLLTVSSKWKSESWETTYYVYLTSRKAGRTIDIQQTNSLWQPDTRILMVKVVL